MTILWILAQLDDAGVSLAVAESVAVVETDRLSDPEASSDGQSWTNKSWVNEKFRDAM
jgi:hypothetical protein